MSKLTITLQIQLNDENVLSEQCDFDYSATTSPTFIYDSVIEHFLKPFDEFEIQKRALQRSKSFKCSWQSHHLPSQSIEQV